VSETVEVKQEASAAQEAAVIVTHGMMIYADGGANPNPGPSGWGIHGFLYSDEKPKKGTGNGGWLLTQRGYIAKADAAHRGGVAEVTPIHYVDGYGSILAINALKKPTNNVGELMAATRALEHAINYDIKRVLVTTDSQYVRKGIEEWVEGWQRNGWIKRDGEPVANDGLWKELIAAKQRLVDRGVEVSFAWVKGHDGHLGNDIADKHATLGVLLSQQEIFKSDVTTTVAEGYWKYDSERHPMLANRRMYFNTVAEYQKPGEYYLGEHGTEDDLLGKRISDGAYSVVRLKEPDASIEFVRNHTTDLACGMDSIIMIRLDQLFSAGTHKEVMRYGTIAMPRANPARLDLNCLDEEPGPGHKRKPLTRECRPPKLAMRAVEALSDLIDKLEMYKGGDALVTATDLTEILYETRDKPVGKKAETVLTMELRPQFVVGFAALEVQANYRVGDGIAQVPVTLTLGIDLLNRNSLKRLEKAYPKVTLLTWLESPTSFRYATVVEADGDAGIWAGVYSNLRMVA
jgi:ribonuclease HI